MRTITEYLINNHVKTCNLSSLFVDSDVVRKSNFEDYVKFRDARYRNVMYIKREDLLYADFDDIFKILQKMFLEYGSNVFICVPVKSNNREFAPCCYISLINGETTVYNYTKDAEDIIKYFQNK